MQNGEFDSVLEEIDSVLEEISNVGFGLFGFVEKEIHEDIVGGGSASPKNLQ